MDKQKSLKKKFKKYPRNMGSGKKPEPTHQEP